MLKPERYLQMLNIVPSNQFRRDLKLAQKRGLKLERLTAVINTLAAQKQSKGSDSLNRSLLRLSPLIHHTDTTVLPVPNAQHLPF